MFSVYCSTVKKKNRKQDFFNHFADTFIQWERYKWESAEKYKLYQKNKLKLLLKQRHSSKVPHPAEWKKTKH